MDCFAVSVVCGVMLRGTSRTGAVLRMAFLFGFFQGMMPLAGWLLTCRFSGTLQQIDHWVAFAMLAFIGGKMVVESFRGEERLSRSPLRLRTQLALAVATSIDALSIGISYACTGYTMQALFVPLSLIAAVSFGMSIAGYLLGHRFGEAVNRRMRPELLGGLILIAIGVKILLEHLFS
ncbi:MAG: manganese efflux pump [Bacteroidales bacterium]|nr:manganese efflux pump [Bacteroidales bacterium]